MNRQGIGLRSYNIIINFTVNAENLVLVLIWRFGDRKVNRQIKFR